MESTCTDFEWSNRKGGLQDEDLGGEGVRDRTTE